MDADLNIGASDVFENNYMADLRSLLSRHGQFIEYHGDRAAIDLGLQLYRHDDAGRHRVGPVRIWMQVKGLMVSTLSAEEFERGATVDLKNIKVSHLKFWYASPEPVYLIAYIESVHSFWAVDVRHYIDGLGGLPYLMALSFQETVTCHLPKAATLAAAVLRMPSHRTMRVDGPQFRGRPLGHNFDPLRSELVPMQEDTYSEVVQALLDAHGFRATSSKVLDGQVVIRRGHLYHTYEWVLPMTTEFGVDEGTDFRIEGEPLYAQGEVLVLVDALGSGPKSIRADLQFAAREAHAAGIDKALVFINVAEDELIRHFAAWRAVLEPLRSYPQAMGSLTYNVLTTTSVYFDMADRLAYNFINYHVG